MFAVIVVLWSLQCHANSILMNAPYPVW